MSILESVSHGRASDEYMESTRAIPRVESMTLSDGSRVFDVVYLDEFGNRLRIACMSEDHAERLAALLNDAARVQIESVQS